MLKWMDLFPGDGSISPQLFQRVARQAEHREDLMAGLEAFLDELIVLPPGKWDPGARIPPPSRLPSPRRRWAGGRAPNPCQPLCRVLQGHLCL